MADQSFAGTGAFQAELKGKQIMAKKTKAKVYRERRAEEQKVLKKQGHRARLDKVKSYLKRYFIDAMGGMAQGLFASLLIGTILGTLGGYIPWAPASDFLTMIATVCKNDFVVGAAIGIGMARAMGASPLVMYASAVVGAGSYSIGLVYDKLAEGLSVLAHYVPGDPLAEGTGKLIAGPGGCFFAVILAVELGMLVSKKTKLDILVTPIVTIAPAMLLARLISPYIAYAMAELGQFITMATTYQPFLMGVVIAVVVGMILTLPISSAAICAMIGISGIAGGAAVVGCCAQMVGFAVISFRENRWGGVVSQGLGTSMLQMGNICRRPQIWIPPTLAAAICGPLSTMLFKLECQGVSAGMGTCGLVGPIGVITATGTSPMTWIGLVLCCVVLPGVLSLLFGEGMRKLGWIKPGDMKLE